MGFSKCVPSVACHQGLCTATVAVTHTLLPYSSSFINSIDTRLRRHTHTTLHSSYKLSIDVLSTTLRESKSVRLDIIRIYVFK